MAGQPHPLPVPGFPPELVQRLLDDALASPGRPPILGITGLQSTGKSTLASQLVSAAQARGLNAVALSIDDFYLSTRERLLLARTVHPLLATRGPPGTHDVALAGDTLDRLRKLRRGERVAIPVFDKLADRRLPPSRWRQVRQRPDLIVFEGWLLGVPPQRDSALRRTVNELERSDDPERVWRSWCNRALAAYAPLWRRIDRLLWLRGPGFELVPHWRWQQEQALVARSPGKHGMTRAQTDRFVLLFERVSRHAHRCLPILADSIVDIDALRGAQIRQR